MHISSREYFSFRSFFSANDFAVFQHEQAPGSRLGDPGRRGRGPTDVAPVRQQNSVQCGHLRSFDRLSRRRLRGVYRDGYVSYIRATVIIILSLRTFLDLKKVPR